MSRTVPRPASKVNSGTSYFRQAPAARRFAARAISHARAAWLFCTVSQRAADADDIEAQITWRSARARIMAARGDRAGAADLARQAVTLAQGTDDLNLSAHAQITLAELVAGESPAEAETAAAVAVELYERKGNQVARRRAAAALAR